MAEEPKRRPYFGSCHCGHTKYVAYLTLPPEKLQVNIQPSESVRIRKCNCSSCHKMGFFHVRLKDSPNDFVLLSPLDPDQGGLSNYTCFDKIIKWYFCGKCGVRCFAMWGEGEVKDLDLEAWLGKPSEGKSTKVWVPKTDDWKEGYMEDQNAYLSVNAHTLEPGQEGLDLKEWHEKKWICYLDTKDEKLDNRYGEPHDGGSY